MIGFMAGPIWRAGGTAFEPRAASRTKNVATTAHLESSAPGVFGIDDIRSDSLQRVGGAIGEGARVVVVIHAFLSHSLTPHL